MVCVTISSFVLFRNHVKISLLPLWMHLRNKSNLLQDQKICYRFHFLVRGKYLDFVVVCILHLTFSLLWIYSAAIMLTFPFWCSIQGDLSRAFEIIFQTYWTFVWRYIIFISIFVRFFTAMNNLITLKANVKGIFFNFLLLLHEVFHFLEILLQFWNLTHIFWWR